jgi:hypothetical protein
MSAPVARAAAQAGKAATKSADSHVLKKGAKRDPELYVQPPVPPELLFLTRPEGFVWPRL